MERTENFIENLRTPYRKSKHITIIVEGDEALWEKVKEALKEIRTPYGEEVSYTLSCMPEFPERFLKK